LFGDSVWKTAGGFPDEIQPRHYILEEVSVPKLVALHLYRPLSAPAYRTDVAGKPDHKCENPS